MESRVILLAVFPQNVAEYSFIKQKAQDFKVTNLDLNSFAVILYELMLSFDITNG
jgi:hypothetical protein